MKHHVILIVAASLLLCIGLEQPALQGSTEPRVAGIVAQMASDGDYLMPRLNGAPFLEKPPLHAWLGTLAAAIGGASRAALRAVSALASLGTLLLVAGFLARRGMGQPVPLLVATALLTMASFWSHSRSVGQDALLTFGVTLALVALYEFVEAQRFRLLLVAAGGVAIAGLTKGVFGLAIPGVAGGGYLLARLIWFRERTPPRTLVRLAGAFLCGLIPLLIWLALLYRREGWWALREVVWANSFERFAGEYTRGEHAERWYFYLRHLPELWQPWLLLVLAGFYGSARRIRSSALDLFLVCWLTLPAVLLTLSSGKRTVYLLSLYPAAAMLLAPLFAAALTDAKRGTAERIVWLVQGAVMTLVVGYAWRLAFDAGIERSAWIAPLLFASIAIIYFWSRLPALPDTRSVTAATAAIAFVFCAYGGTILARLTDPVSLESLFQTTRSREGCCDRLALFQPTERLSGAAFFSMGRVVPELHSIEEMKRFLAPGSNAYILSTKTAVLEEGSELDRFHVGRTGYFLVTAPAATASVTSAAESAMAISAAQACATTFAVIGDYGYAGRAEERVASLVKGWGPDFIVTTGDNNYPAGEAHTIDQNIGQYYHEYIHPYRGTYGEGAHENRFFPALGNHDWASPAGDSPYLDYFTLPGNGRYYDILIGPVHLFILDSDGHEPDGIDSDSLQAGWLKLGLGHSPATWRIVVLHHAPYSSGALHGSTERLQWPYGEWGADVVLAGHEHTYERLDVAGITYVVDGVGGHSVRTFGEPLGKDGGPAVSRVRYDGDYGALRITANRTRLALSFVNVEGEQIDEAALSPRPGRTPRAAGCGSTRAN